MNRFPSTLMIRVIPLLIVAFALFTPRALAAEPAGYWEGSIELPGTSLGIHVFLERAPAAAAQGGGVWKGVIDIPVQALRGFALEGVAVEGDQVGFAMPGIPGAPAFAGQLDAAGTTITGHFTQRGGSFPFSLKRIGDTIPVRPGQTPTRGIPGQGLPGRWQGSIRQGPIELRLVLHVGLSDDGELAATLDSIDQGAIGLSIERISLTEDGAAAFRLGDAATYAGTMSADGSQIDGIWTQGGGEIPLNFMRLAADAPTGLNRPQEPKPPFPYEVTNVEVDVEPGVLLAGTLTLPVGDGAFPAALLITGSGPQDRDESLMGHKPFLVIADHLTRHGIAVLRVDDRGVGESTGDYSTATTDEFVADAVASLRFLAEHPRIDRRRIGIVGHSEGGVTGPLAALQPGTSVAYMVLLAAPGVPMGQLLERQSADIARVMGASAEDLAGQAELNRRIFRTIAEQGDTPQARQAVRQIIDEAMADLTDEQRQAAAAAGAGGQIDMLFSPWFRKLMVYDPAPTFRRITVPVLALNGVLDLQVAAAENLAGIDAALKEAGNGDFQTHLLPSLNHLFQHATTGAMTEYGQIEETFDPATLQIISDWINHRFRPTPP